MGNQRGITVIGMIVACIVIIIVAIGGLKIAPAYIEYFKAKKAIVVIAQTRGSSVQQIREAFERRSAIDDIDVIGPKDLDITKEGNDVVVSFAYSKRIPLFANVNVVIDFAAHSNE